MPPSNEDRPSKSDTSSSDRADLSILRMDREEEEEPRRFRGLIVLAILGALLAVAFFAVKDHLPFLRESVETTAVVSTTPTEASTVLTATGYTYARTRAAVGSKIIGRVTDLRVDEGDRFSTATHKQIDFTRTCSIALRRIGDWH